MKITAGEARQLTSNAKNVNIDDIYEVIRRAAASGDNIVRFALKQRHLKAVDVIIDKLKADGFLIKRDCGSDQRESCTWDDLIIEW